MVETVNVTAIYVVLSFPYKIEVNETCFVTIPNLPKEVIDSAVRNKTPITFHEYTYSPAYVSGVVVGYDKDEGVQFVTNTNKLGVRTTSKGWVDNIKIEPLIEED